MRKNSLVLFCPLLFLGGSDIGRTKKKRARKKEEEKIHSFEDSLRSIVVIFLLFFCWRETFLSHFAPSQLFLNQGVVYVKYFAECFIELKPQITSRPQFSRTLRNVSSKKTVFDFHFPFFSRKLLSATVRRGMTGFFYWMGSDSWGAKIHPVRHQEWAAEGAITILPKRSSLKGRNGDYDNKYAISPRVLF